MGKSPYPGVRMISDDLPSYGRIETLSGFANGIFLVLISMFIVFEAIQRLSVKFHLRILVVSDITQAGSSRNEHEPTLTDQHDGIRRQLIRHVCDGRSPSSWAWALAWT